MQGSDVAEDSVSVRYLINKTLICNFQNWKCWYSLLCVRSIEWNRRHCYLMQLRDRRNQIAMYVAPMRRQEEMFIE